MTRKPKPGRSLMTTWLWSLGTLRVGDLTGDQRYVSFTGLCRMFPRSSVEPLLRVREALTDSGRIAQLNRRLVFGQLVVANSRKFARGFAPFRTLLRRRP